MKNKWTKVVAMFFVGFVAYSISQNMNSTLGSILTIVGVILMIGGVVEIFKKSKKIEGVSEDSK